MKPWPPRPSYPPWLLARSVFLALSALLHCALAVSAEATPEDGAVPTPLIQSALEILGHYEGPSHGRLDAATRAAIGSWQESAGFRVTEELRPDQQRKLIREGAAAGLAEAQQLLEQTETPPEPPPPSDSERINVLETTLEGFDQALKTAVDAIDANSQAVADLGTRLDSELNKVDTLALRIDSLDAQLNESNRVLEAQKSRIEDNSIKLYETLMNIDRAAQDMGRMARAFDRLRSAHIEEEARAPGNEIDDDHFGLPLILLLCLLVPLAVYMYQSDVRPMATVATSEIKHFAWVLVSWFGGSAGFFLIGIGILYGPSSAGLIGNPLHFVGEVLLSAPASLTPALSDLFVAHLILAGIVSVVACSGASHGLTNRGHFLVAFAAGGLIYPLFRHWIATPTAIADQSGWLATSGALFPAATTDVALLSGALALSVAGGLGLIRIRRGARAHAPTPSSTGTPGAMLLWFAWIGVILVATSDALPASMLLLTLAGAGGGAALGVLVLDGLTSPTEQWQNRVSFAVLAGVVAAPGSIQQANFIELTALGAVTGVSASLLMRFLDLRSATDLKLPLALLSGGTFGTLAPAVFGSTGFLFARSLDVLLPQLQVIGSALILAVVGGRALAWPIGLSGFSRRPT